MFQIVGGLQLISEAFFNFDLSQHDIVLDIELINMDYINTAYERMLKSDVKYRFVINMANL